MTTDPGMYAKITTEQLTIATWRGEPVRVLLTPPDEVGMSHPAQLLTHAIVGAVASSQPNNAGRLLTFHIGSEPKLTCHVLMGGGPLSFHCEDGQTENTLKHVHANTDALVERLQRTVRELDEAAAGAELSVRLAEERLRAAMREIRAERDVLDRREAAQFRLAITAGVQPDAIFREYGKVAELAELAIRFYGSVEGLVRALEVHERLSPADRDGIARKRELLAALELRGERS